MNTQKKHKDYLALTKKFLKSNANADDYNALVELLQYHERRYYIDNEPLISDKDYDTLFDQLKSIEASNPLILRTDSPSQRVSSDLNSDFQTVKHYNPMLSLSNSYNKVDLVEFDEQVKKLINTSANEIGYFIEPKYDGGSVALVYENDQLVRGATRGNGAEGDDITNNIRALPSIPLRATFSELGIYRAELRGEAVIAKDVFEQNNQKREEAGLQVFANPRNAATGGLRMKDPQETQNRGLEVFIFQLAYAVDRNGQDKLEAIGSHHHSIRLLKELGFKVSLEKEQIADNILDAVKACERWELDRSKFHYEIDGAVVKVDDIKLQNTCGSTQHHPRWAVAFKFEAKQGHTTLLDVEYQVGKTGAVTPVAKVEPIHLAGVTISSISIHNQEFIDQKDLRLGDTIVIERAGDVIPYIVKSLPELRDGSEQKIVFPVVCPSCNTTLEKSADQAAWRCHNPSCKAQLLQKMIYHVSKDAMNIDGFGKSYVETFHKKGWLDDLSAIYNLDYQAISELEGFGKKSADKLEAAIETAKSNPIHRLLVSLSIHHLGRKASKLIAQEIDHVLDLRDWKEEDFMDIKDIGPVVSENVMAYFSEEHHVQMLQKMESLGVNLNQLEADRPKVISADAPLIGKTILFTGSLNIMSRKVAQTRAEEAGAKNISAVSSKLDILVVGEKAGSKLKKAEALGTVKIMTEAEFAELISNT